MNTTDQSIDTAIVSGASRGFGRAIATELVAAGWRVVGLARTTRDLQEVRDEAGDGFIPVTSDAADEAVAESMITRFQPRLLVLNAGAVPHMAPLTQHTWETFSANWSTDTRHAFHWIRAALTEPLAPGSTVVSMSSGAALRGSPLSGGYAGAKATIRFMSDYAADESDRTGLDIRFFTLFPMMSPTGVGAAGVAAYAAQQGVDEDAFVAGLQPVLTPQMVGKSVLDLIAEPAPASGYVLTGAGPRSVGRDT